jgi:hypothetical protein
MLTKVLQHSDPLQRGIKADLSSGKLCKTRPSQDAIYYWDTVVQEVVLDSLGEYLPRVSEDKENHLALFSKYRGKSELCSTSNPLDERGVASDEKRGLLRGIDEIESKLTDKRIDPNAKIILQKFMLPDPEKLPEFYRLSGGRLLIIWGCETNRMDLLPAREAIEKLKIDPGYKVVARRTMPLFKKWLLPLLIFLLIAILCLLIANESCDSGSPIQTVEENTSPKTKTTEKDGSGPEGPNGENESDGSGKIIEPSQDDPSNQSDQQEENGDPKNPDGTVISEKEYLVWLPTLIDDQQFHATTLAGFSEDGMSVFLAEPDDNERGSHTFPPNANFTQAALSMEDGYPSLKIQISGQTIKSYVIGLFYPDYSKVLGNQKNDSAPIVSSGMPDLSQNSHRHWKNLCAPTAGANLLWYMSQKPHIVHHKSLSPFVSFAKNPAFERMLKHSGDPQPSAADFLIHGLNAPMNNPLPQSLSGRMKSSDKGTKIEDLASGMIGYLNDYDQQYGWEVSFENLDKDEVPSLMKKIIQNRTAALLMLKINTPPEIRKTLIQIKAVAQEKTSNQEEDALPSQDLKIQLISGSEKNYSNKMIGGRLQVRDGRMPNSSLTNIKWLIGNDGKWQKLEGDGQIIDFRRPKGSYSIGVIAVNSDGKGVNASAVVTLDAKETQQVTPSVTVKQR